MVRESDPIHVRRLRCGGRVDRGRAASPAALLRFGLLLQRDPALDTTNVTTILYDDDVADADGDSYLIFSQSLTELPELVVVPLPHLSYTQAIGQ